MDEEGFGGIVGLVAGLIALYLFLWVIAKIFSVSCFLACGLMTACDRVFGGWSSIPEPYEWGASGFVIASVAFFASVEARRINRPLVGKLLLALLSLLVVGHIVVLCLADELPRY